MRVAGHMASRYYCPLYSLCHFSLFLIFSLLLWNWQSYSMSDVIVIIFTWIRTVQGWMARSLCSLVQCTLSTTITVSIRCVSACGCSLYKAIGNIFGESILLILSNLQYFGGVHTPYTKQFAVLSGSILLILSNTQYFRGVITAFI